MADVRARAFSVLLLLGALGASVAVGEAGLRAYGALDPAIGAQLREWDPEVSSIELMGERAYRPRPGAAFHYQNGAVSHMNARGYRGPLVAVPKPPGVFRVVLLGGSTTHGAGVDDDATLDAHLRRILAERYPGRRFEVVNLGFDAYDAECDRERFERDGRALEPDVVVIHSGINDVAGARTADVATRPPHPFDPALERLRQRGRGVPPSAWDRTKHHLFLARVPGLLRRVHAAPMPGPASPPAGGTRRFAEQLARTAEAAGPGPVLLFSTPPSSLRFPDPPLVARAGLVNDAVTTQRYRDALDLEMRAVARLLAGRGRRAVYVPHEVPVGMFLDDCHLTPEGNRRVATDFADALRPFLDGQAAGFSTIQSSMTRASSPVV